jgi:hypothetical protein
MFLSVVNTRETDGLGELVFPLWLEKQVSSKDSPLRRCKSNSLDGQMCQGREKGGWPLHTDVLELQPGQSWRLIIEDGRGECVLGIVVRYLEYEGLQNRSMDRRVEDLENVGSELPRPWRGDGVHDNGMRGR